MNRSTKDEDHYDNCVKLVPYIGSLALSIRAPWPAWIMGNKADRKQWENRVWRKSFRPTYRGPVLIHMSSWWNEEDVCDTITEVGQEWLDTHKRMMCAGVPDNLNTPRKIHALRGHLLGWVDLVDIKPASELAGEFWVDEGGDSPPDHCALRLENPRMLDEPVPCRGQIGLFRISHRSSKP